MHLTDKTATAVVVLLVSFLLAPAPPPSADHPAWAVNLNYVYGFADRRSQTLMPPPLWLLCLTRFTVMVVYVPTHYALQRNFTQPSA